MQQDKATPFYLEKKRARGSCACAIRFQKAVWGQYTFVELGNEVRSQAKNNANYI